MAVQMRATKASETQTRGTLTPLERSAMKLVIGRQSSENQQDRGQQSPRNRENERERKHVGNKANEILDWDVVIHQQRQELAKNIANDEDETGGQRSRTKIHDQLAADETVDQLHLLIR